MAWTGSSTWTGTDVWTGADGVGTVTEVAWDGAVMWTGTDLWGRDPLPAPLSLVTQTIASNQIDLQWTAIPYASGYDIERDGVIIAYGWSAASYSDVGVSTAVTHTYRIRAVE